MIPYGRQSLDKKDILSVKKILQSNFLTQGPTVTKFEKKIAEYCNVKFCAASSSASSALYLACRTLNLSKGEIFWTVPNTYVATANAGLLCGAKIDFVDIDKDTGNICLNKLEQKLKISKKLKKLPKIIMPVHFAGVPFNQQKLKLLSKKYKFKIIEDASHALGSVNNGSKVGSCKWSDITVFSFHPIKTITTGEGGALTTNKKEYYQKIKILTSNGVTKNSRDYKKKINKSWYYEQHFLSLNFRMSDINAALGLSQIKKINLFVKKRNQIARNYNRAFSGLNIKLPKNFKGKYSSFHLYVIKVEKSIRNKLFDYLVKNKIYVNLHYLPVHLQPLYENMKIKRRDLINSEEHALSAISLPIFPDLNKKEQTRVIKVIRLFFKRNNNHNDPSKKKMTKNKDF